MLTSITVDVLRAGSKVRRNHYRSGGRASHAAFIFCHVIVVVVHPVGRGLLPCRRSATRKVSKSQPLGVEKGAYLAAVTRRRRFTGFAGFLEAGSSLACGTPSQRRMLSRE